MNYFVEALIVGLGTLVVGLIVAWIANMIQRKPFPSFKQILIIALVFFATGFLVHIIAEWIGINRWYCKNGYACSKL